MTKFALYVPLEAKPGKEKEVADFLRSAVPLVNAEVGTISWFAIQEGPSSFAIFDTFDDEAGRDAHLNGGVDGKSQGRRAVCQNAGDPQARNSRGQASKIKVRLRVPLQCHSTRPDVPGCLTPGLIHE
jgi:quinol monooxygenase YgiN